MKGLCFADKAAWVYGLSCWLSIAPLQPATHYPTAFPSGIKEIYSPHKGNSFWLGKE